ncbi:DUF4105 domain-containing protein [Halobacteriovorax sp.]|uniref:Lnb N-terminal periplasmic domain-containing protein n=1 Tax=Halobacteriovorax sp. TaxID=2020862 RepID=UPI00356B04BA
MSLHSRASDVLDDKIKKVSNEHYWKKLIHFHDGYLNSESYADSDSFFLSPVGKIDLSEELKSTINAFKKIDKSYTPQKIPAQCAFPERLKFIREKFPEINFKETDCPYFQQWKKAVKGESLSLVFASSFVNNPSSMFGHTFLKFNKKENESLSKDMFNYVVAFSAKANDTPGILYAIKGLFGGYKGIVDVQPFYLTLREYSKVESRDIWEYKLNLTEDQLDSLVNHIWELYANANFDYYFFDENCTSMLARVLALVTNEAFDEEMEGYALPTDFLRILKTYKLVESTNYFPSLRKQFFASYKILSADQKKSFQQLLDDNLHEGDNKTLNSLVHYFDYIRHDHENIVSKEFQLKQKKILSMASKKGILEQAKVSIPVSPDNGHLPSRLDLFYGKVNDQESLSFNLRPSFHSLIDPGEGYEPWSHIEFFNFQLMYNMDEKEVDLNELIIANIQSLPDFKLLDTNTSWSLDVKVRPIFEESKLSSHKGSINLNMGLSKHSELFLISIMTGARLEGHSSFENYFKLGPNVKLNLGLNIFNTKIILESSYFYSLLKPSINNHRDYLETRLQLSTQLSNTISLRLEGKSISRVGDISKEAYKSYLLGFGMFY